MSDEAVVRCSSLKKTYRDDGVPVHALKGVDLAFRKGDFACIAGPSGSGKTTLLNLLGGLDLPSEGRVFVEEAEVSSMSRTERADLRLRRIGFVFQAFNLLPVLTAAENVEYVLLLQQTPKRERRERVREVMETLGMGEYLDRLPSELSGGQQQRVAVARALAARPAIVLLDEPTASLDSETGGRLMDYLEEMNTAEGHTFLFCSHDEMVIDRARRLIRLKDGQIESDVEQGG
ncbi:MAG: ATP-binding cassette domain-containing protein [bacterium]